MGANKIGSYIVNYRSKRKEAVEEERRRREQEFGRRPEIVDPSYELFGQKTQQPQLYQEEPFRNDSTASQMSSDDWTFQSRRANTSPELYQMEPYCEVTPKSSVSSNASKASTTPSQQDYNMGWESSEQTRPRPQSYLPPVIAQTSSTYTADHNRSISHQSRRHTMLQESLPTRSIETSIQSAYKLEASLTKPFSMDDPMDFWSEPVQTSPTTFDRQKSSGSRFDNSRDNR